MPILSEAKRGRSTATGCSSGRAALCAHERDDSVVALTIDAVSIRGFFQRADGQQSLHENLKKFDEAAELLHRDDQPVVFFSKMLLHELRGLPIHQFALGRIGAALGLGSFRSNVFETSVRIQGGFASARWDDLSF